MKYFALVDCDNFYVSCERLFNPSLIGRPVIVLSNNDGCVVSRSQEAKKLGIKMGEPYFQIKQLCERLKIAVYSSNYALYGDLSQRVMQILGNAAEDIEVYSIDEAFLTFTSKSPTELFEICKELRRLIKKWVGISVSIGIAPTKTLAKVGSAIAKKNGQGIYALCSDTEQILREFPVEDVWGVGSSTRAKLAARGVTTAWEFQTQDPLSIRKLMGVVGERMLWELRGVSCLPLERVVAKKSITTSRSFGKTLTLHEDISNALCTYVNTACVKLRQQKSCTQAISVFVDLAVDYSNSQPYIRPLQHSIIVPFDFPTNDTPQIINAAKRGLAYLFREGLRYKKCGVILLDLMPEAQVVPDLFSNKIDIKRKRTAEVFDDLNRRFGKNTLFYGAMGVNPHWKMRRKENYKSDSSGWDGLPIAKA